MKLIAKFVATIIKPMKCRFPAKRATECNQMIVECRKDFAMTITKHYEVSPCRVVPSFPREGEEIERCNPEYAEFYTVYRRMTDGRALAVCDCLTQEDAESCVLELNNLLEPLQEINGCKGSLNEEHRLLAKAREAIMTGA